MVDFNEFLDDFSLDTSSGSDEQPEYSTEEYSPEYEENTYSFDDEYSGSYSKEDEYAEEEDYDEPEEKGSKFSFKMPDLSGVKSGAKKAVSGSGSNLVSIGLVICILMSLISLISVGSLKKTVSSNNEAINSQLTILANEISEIGNRISSLESGVSTVQQQTSTVSTDSKYITISKQPTSVSTWLGRGGDDEEIGLCFSVEAKGNSLTVNSFQWQIKSSTGDWINIGFDGTNSVNETYGLQHSVEIASGVYTSKVYAKGLTSAGFGTYRCVITDSTGEVKISDTVTISEKK